MNDTRALCQNKRVCGAVLCLVVVRDEEHERVARHAGRCNDPMQRRLRPTAAALPSDAVSSARAPSDRECTEWRHRAAMQRDAMRCDAMRWPDDVAAAAAAA